MNWNNWNNSEIVLLIITFGGSDGVDMISGDIFELLLPLLFNPIALDIIVGGVFNGIKLFKNNESRVAWNI